MSETTRPDFLTPADAGPHVGTTWPLPGSGQTADRWNRLTALARRDLALVKIVEPHHDAHAILTDLAGPGGPSQQPGSIWAVWAAELPTARLEATRERGGWRLSGRKAFCSGAHVVTDALVTAATPEGSRLFAVAVGRGIAIDPDAPAWTGAGMSRADTHALIFDAVSATAVGRVGQYVERAGFWHGAIGIAACWYGGALAIGDTLERSSSRLDSHGRAHLGAVRADLDNLGAVLDHAGQLIDDGYGDTVAAAERLALTVRAFASDVAERVIARTGRALGPGPLAFDAQSPGHAARVADLQMFVRQHHAEQDLERLGSLDVPDE